VRIDRSDLADEHGSADMARFARSALDNQEAAGKDHDRAVAGDGPLDSSPASVDSAPRIERSTAYRAAVDAAYRQYAIDHGTRNADGLGSVARETAAADVPTGARGPASGREFDPEAAGGPIRQLDARTARITDEGVQEVAAHLRRFTGGGSLDAPEQGMLDRLTSIASGAIQPTSYDLNFFTHELDEGGRYAQLGFGPESGVDLGSSEMYEVWNDVHTAALEDYGIRGADLFYPGLAS
jgi:hypothetical protein